MVQYYTLYQLRSSQLGAPTLVALYGFWNRHWIGSNIVSCFFQSNPYQAFKVFLFIMPICLVTICIAVIQTLSILCRSSIVPLPCLFALLLWCWGTLAVKRNWKVKVHAWLLSLGERRGDVFSARKTTWLIEASGSGGINVILVDKRKKEKYNVTEHNYIYACLYQKLHPFTPQNKNALGCPPTDE